MTLKFTIQTLPDKEAAKDNSWLPPTTDHASDNKPTAEPTALSLETLQIDYFDKQYHVWVNGVFQPLRDNTCLKLDQYQIDVQIKGDHQPEQVGLLDYYRRAIFTEISHLAPFQPTHIKTKPPSFDKALIKESQFISPRESINDFFHFEKFEKFEKKEKTTPTSEQEDNTMKNNLETLYDNNLANAHQRGNILQILGVASVTAEKTSVISSPTNHPDSSDILAILAQPTERDKTISPQKIKSKPKEK